MAIVQNPNLYERVLACSITLTTGVFQPNLNTLLVNDHTINATVHKTLSNNFTETADITIFGLSPSDINALKTTGFSPLAYQQNKIELYASYKTKSGQNNTSSLCFKGNIVRAFADYSDPSRPMKFECATYLDSIGESSLINAQGSISAQTIFKNIADNLGLALINNGVTGVFYNLILTGSAIEQLKNVSKQLNVNAVIDKGTLTIAPKSGGLTKTILKIGADSGLISYPTLDNWGVKFRMRYNPVLSIGQQIELNTSKTLPNPTGKFFVYDMQSSLNNRHDDWFSDVKCSFDPNFFGS